MTQPDPITELAQRFVLWKECLNGEDTNSVTSQLSSLTWDAAAFRTVNEARRISSERTNGNVEQNGMMHQLLDRCYFFSQCSRVRRLVDSSYPLLKEGKVDKSVYSLGSLLRDMQQKCDLLTRKNWLAVSGVDYDLQSINDKMMDFIRTNMPDSTQALILPDHVDIGIAHILHKQFDTLSGVSENSRSPSDLIDVNIFKDLESRMNDATKEIRLYATNYLAHASTVPSRESSGASDLAISLSKLAEAQRILCVIHCTLNYYFFRVHQPTYLPIPNHDPLAYMDQPLVTAHEIVRLREFWKKQEQLAKTYKALNISEFSCRQRKT